MLAQAAQVFTPGIAATRAIDDRRISTPAGVSGWAGAHCRPRAGLHENAFPDQLVTFELSDPDRKRRVSGP
jgi:hypothetical protein